MRSPEQAPRGCGGGARARWGGENQRGGPNRSAIVGKQRKRGRRGGRRTKTRCAEPRPRKKDEGAARSCTTPSGCSGSGRRRGTRGLKRHGVERAGRTPRMRKEGRRTGGRGKERQEQIRGRPRQVRGRGEARGRPWGEEIRGIGGKRVGGFRATVVGRNKRLFTKKEERSGKGERGENEGQDVTRRNATGRRLNPVGE